MIVIYAPHFTAAVLHHDNKITHTAPIVKYLIGYSVDEVKLMCKKKGWTWLEIL